MTGKNLGDGWLGERPLDQILGLETEALHLGGDGGPAIVEKILALCGSKPLARTFGDEHADPALHENQAFVLEGLVGLGHGERIGPMLRGEAADRGERVSVAHLAVQNGGSDGIAEAEIDWTIVVWHGAILT